MNAPERTLSFRLDGTIDPAELEGMPEDFVTRVTSPEFVEQARMRIALDIQANQRRQAFLEQAAAVKRAAIAVHELRRPSGLSGRQRRLARKGRRRTVLDCKANQPNVEATHGASG